MGLNRIFQAFQPKDKVFYKLFDKITQNLVAMARFFQESLGSGVDLDEALLAQFKAFEHQNDDDTHAVYQNLSKVFITPFDREDITMLASNLDDIADYLYASVEYLVLYKTPYLKVYEEFAELIVASCLELQNAMSHLRDFKSQDAVKASCIRINELENQADRLFSAAMVSLFEGDDAMRVIKVSSVLRHLEEVTDRAETVAHTIQNIMIKYA